MKTSRTGYRQLNYASRGSEKPLTNYCRRILLGRTGFTLIELLVTIGIIGILIGLLLPAIHMVRESARRVSCANNAKQVALAALSFESARKSFPQGIRAHNDERSYASWLIEILPFVEQDNLYKQSVEDYQVTNNPLNHRGIGAVVATYQCPGDPHTGIVVIEGGNPVGVAPTTYLGCSGTDYVQEDGVLFRASKVRPSDIHDGLSNTLLFGERPFSTAYHFGQWYGGIGMLGTGAADVTLGVQELNPLRGVYNDCSPGPFRFQASRPNDPCNFLHYWSYHPGGANFAMCDGSVRFVSYSSHSLISKLATRSGAEP